MPVDRDGLYPELTFTAIIVGYAVGALITLSIGYTSLSLGFSIEGSELAAILGFGILRGALRRSSIVENNINQTIASSVNGASAGMMFSVPALFILYPKPAFDPVLVVVGCIAGGVLGIAFIIPLRKQMIEYQRLTFPGGIAVAAVLRSPGAGMAKVAWLLGGAVASACAHAVVLYFDRSTVDAGSALGLPDYLNVVFRLSLLTVGVAYLAGRGGIFFVIGGLVCYWFLAPLLAFLGDLPGADALDGKPVTAHLREDLFRPVGIGMLIGGALAGIVLALPLVIGAVRSMQQAAKLGVRAAREELPIRFLYGAVAAAFVLLLVISELAGAEIGLVRGALMALLGTLWIWMAGVVLSECIGRTNWSPLSGMTLIGITVLIAAATIGSGGGESGSGGDPTAAVIASIVVGAAMCVAMAQATDLMLDLKTGHLVGATPRVQQIGQLLGTWLGPILVMALILALARTEEIGGEKFPAPQGQALAAVIRGIVGGDIPYGQYAAGAGLGALLSASGIGGLGVLVGLGFYLPFPIVLSYLVGTILRLLSDWRLGRGFAEDVGIPISAGLIVGEALVGVAHAFWKIAVME